MKANWLGPGAAHSSTHCHRPVRFTCADASVATSAADIATALSTAFILTLLGDRTPRFAACHHRWPARRGAANITSVWRVPLISPNAVVNGPLPGAPNGIGMPCALTVQ